MLLSSALANRTVRGDTVSPFRPRLTPLRSALQEKTEEPYHPVRIPIDPPKYADLLHTLLTSSLLPAIVFLTSRRGCDDAVDSFRSGRLPDLSAAQQSRMESLIDEFGEEAAFIRNHRQYALLVRKGVAAHHAGQLPAWKHIVEKLMSNGLLRAVFATSTLAAGIDMPARSVVITASNLRTNEGHRDIKAFELAQMTGRAGRRGRDKVGFAIFIPGPFQDIHVIAEQLLRPPEPLESSFAANYTMVLNLLQQLTPEAARALVERSFRQFQNLKQIETLRPRVMQVKRLLEDDAALCPAGDRARTFAAYTADAHELSATRRHVKRLHRYLKRDDDAPLDAEQQDIIREEIAGAERAVTALEARIAAGACASCAELRRCPGRAAEMSRHAQEHERLSERLAAIENGLWGQFEDCVRVLQHYDYLTDDWRPTASGEWAAGLRVENTLFIAELIRLGFFDVGDARHLAALCGALAAEEREFPMYSNHRNEDYLRPLRRAKGVAHAVATVQERNHVYCPMYIDSDAARLLWAWADSRLEWDRLLELTEAIEGDVVRLILRTSDLLGQLSGLSESHPELATLARTAMRLIRRPPVED